MSSKAVVGIVNSELVAAQIFEELQNAEFSNGDISILIPEGSHLAHEKSSKLPEGAATPTTPKLATRRRRRRSRN